MVRKFLRELHRAIFLAIVVVTTSATLSTPTSAAPNNSLPPGVQLAGIGYYDVYLNSFANLQLAVASTERETSYEDRGIFTDSYGAPYACVGADNPLGILTYINGVSERWCVQDHRTGYTGGSSTNPLDVAQVVPFCPPGSITNAPYLYPKIGTLKNGALYQQWLCEVPTIVTASIETPLPVKIPAGTNAVDGRVLTQDTLLAFVSQGSAQTPVGGIPVNFQSSRLGQDNISQPTAPTNQSGETSGAISTRNNANGAESTVDATGPGIQSSIPKSITWLPARYGSPFLLTCYVISLESDFLNTPLVNAPGIVGTKYRAGFLKDTELQGTGETLTGKYIHYQGNGMFMQLPSACAPTRSGACAVDGTTAAVDPQVIPLRSNISIASVGDRVAQDTGGGIDGYHIDLYFGTRRAACDQLGRQQGSSVTLLNYGN